MVTASREAGEPDKLNSQTRSDTPHTMTVSPTFLLPRRLAVAFAIALLAYSCTNERGAPDLRTLDSPAGADSLAPHLSQAPGGKIILSWLGRHEDASVLRYARLDGNQWSAPADVVSDPALLRNWADVPAVQHLDNGAMVAHWLVENPASPYAYDAWFQLSEDGGESWTSAARLNTDGMAAEHGFVSAFATGDEIGMVWLDGRNAAHGAHGAGATELRSARFSVSGERLFETVLDTRVCDCCQTDISTSRGHSYLVYRDRTLSEERDIAINVFGDEWQGARKVNPDEWMIDACPVNGPAVSAAGNALAYIWFTAAEGKPRIRVARSLDRGVSFAETVMQGIDAPLGRVDIVMLHDGRIVLSWMESVGDGRAELRAQLYDLHGRTEGHQVITNMSASSASGFPQMVQAGTKLVFAWTDADGGAPQVKTAALALSAL